MARAVAPADGSPRRKLYREGSPGERWWFALLLVPASLTALAVYLGGGSVEAELQQQTAASLQAAGLTGVTVDMHGRNATLNVPTGQNEATAKTAAESIAGLGDIEVKHVARNAAEARACEDLQTKIDSATGGRGVRFEGSSTSLSGAGAASVHAIAKLLVRCPSADVVANGYTDGSVLNGSTVSLRRAETVRKALVRDGVKVTSVDTQGFGDSFPLSTQDSPAGRAANNRVSITLVED
jgi:outer membrane protein OmpA-like peptidoglycan-associated protein